MPDRRVHIAVLVAAVVFPLSPSPSTAGTFLRGEVDGRFRLSVTDAVHVLQFLFSGRTLPCEDAADFDDSGRIEISDAVSILRFVFADGPPPAPPYPERCGVDPTEDALDCETSFFSGDGFVFVIDRSSGFRASGGLAAAKREVLGTVEALSSCTRFGVVYFDRGVLRYPSSGIPVAGSGENRESGAAWVEAVGAGSGTCVQAGLLAGIDMATKADTQRTVITFFGDGSGTCPGSNEAAYLEATLTAVAESNDGRFPINVVGLTTSSGNQRAFLQRLAAQNGGTFSVIRP